jgi:hypothetical protein
MAQSLVWENRRHDDEMTALQQRLSKTQDELALYTQDKNGLEIKVAELDQLVSQLLVLNESLVSQLSGRPSKASKSSSSSTKKKTIVKKSSKSNGSGGVNKDVSTAAKALLESSLKTDNVDQLKAMHKMYASMAKTMIRSESPKKKLGTKSTPSSRTSSPAKGRDTRMSRKKTTLDTSANNSKGYSNSNDDFGVSGISAVSSLNNNFSNSNSNSMTRREVRIPKPGVTFDQSYDSDYQTTRSYHSDHEDEFATRRDFQDFLSTRHPPSTSPMPTSTTSTSRSSMMTPNSTGLRQSFNGSSSNQKSDLQAMISSLESEFDSLNSEYRQLLHNVSASSSVIPASTSAESIQQQAEEIVNVIQKLHEKGEQLRQLKSPIKS